MFKTTPQDFYNHITKSMEAFPKTPGDVKTIMEKVQKVYTVEANKAAECIKTYQKAATGDASVNEIGLANKQAQELAIAARFATIMSIPGAIFMIPALKEIELKLDAVDLIPESVKREFDLQ